MNSMFNEREEFQEFSMLETEGVVSEAPFPWKKVGVYVLNIVCAVVSGSETEK